MMNLYWLKLCVDPMGLCGRTVSMVRAIPGVDSAEAVLKRLEVTGRAELAARLREPDSPSPSPPTPPPPPPPPTPRELLERLLRRSMHITPAQSFETLAMQVLHALVPDEARILSALSDGSTYPVIHVESGAVGRPTRRVLSHASSVGRAAGVALPHRTPEYLAHMLALGLIELGPEDRTLSDEYDILLTDSRVKRAKLKVTSGQRRQTRYVKCVVELSELGRELWDSCHFLDDDMGAYSDDTGAP